MRIKRTKQPKTKPKPAPPFRPITGYDELPVPFIIQAERKFRRKRRGRPRKYRPPSTNLIMRIYQNEKRDWDRAAEILGLTTATMIRLAVRRFLRNPNAPKKEDGMEAGVYRRSLPQAKRLKKLADLGFGGRNLETKPVRETKARMAERQELIEAAVAAHKQIAQVMAPISPNGKRRLIVPTGGQ